MFSVIMPTYNRSALLAKTLDAVFAMRGVEGCEVIVVDDGSKDDTFALLTSLASKHSNLKPIRQENAGAGAARNTALRQASMRYALCLDDDVRPCVELLEAHRERLESGFDLSQGNIVWDESLLNNPLIQYIERNRLQFRLDQYKDGNIISYQHVYTANVAFSVADFNEVGGFDDFFTERRYGFEDTAFAWKLEKHGRRLGYAAKAEARHFHPWTEESLLRMEYSVGYNLVFSAKNYPEMAADLGYQRILGSAGWMYPLAALLDKTGVAKLFGANFRRRIATKHAFLRGFRDGLIKIGGGKK